MSIANPCPIEISFIQFGIKRRLFRVANYGFFTYRSKTAPSKETSREQSLQGQGIVDISL